MDTHTHWTGKQSGLTRGPGDKNLEDRSNGTGLGGGNVSGQVRETKSWPPLPPKGRSPECTLHSHPLLIHTESLILGLLCFQEQSPPDPLESPGLKDQISHLAQLPTVSLIQIPHPSASWHTPALVNIWQMNL